MHVYFCSFYIKHIYRCEYVTHVTQGSYLWFPVLRHSQAFQIYLLTNDENFAMPAGLAEALRLGVNALVLTVDANAPRWDG